MWNLHKVAHKQEVMSHMTRFSFSPDVRPVAEDELMDEADLNLIDCWRRDLKSERAPLLLLLLWEHRESLLSDFTNLDQTDVKSCFTSKIHLSLDHSTTCWPGAKWSTVPLTRITAAYVCFPGLAFERSDITVLKSVSIRHTSWFGHHSRWGGGAEGKGQGTGLLGAGSLSLIANQTRLEPCKSLIPVKRRLVIQTEPIRTHLVIKRVWVAADRMT